MAVERSQPRNHLHGLEQEAKKANPEQIKNCFHASTVYPRFLKNHCASLDVWQIPNWSDLLPYFHKGEGEAEGVGRAETAPI